MSNILTDNTRTRRLAASVLAGVVLLGGMAGLSGTAMAAGAGTITLTAPAGETLANHTFSAYKIGDYSGYADANANGKIDSTNVTNAAGTQAWLKAALAKAGLSVDSAKGLDEAGTLAATTQAAKLSTVANALADAANKPGAVVADKTSNTGSLTLNVPGEGLYLVVDSDGLPIIVGTKINGKDLEKQALGTAVIKSTSISVDKEGSGDTTIGKTVHYTATFKIPQKSANPTKLSYTDQPTNLTIVRNSLKIKVDNQAAVAVPSQAIKWNQDGGFTLTGDSYLSDATYGKTVVISYDATVTGKDPHNTGTVKATLADKPKTAADEVTLANFDFDLAKVKADGRTAVKDAGFVIKNQAGKYMKLDAASGKWSDMDAKNAAEAKAAGAERLTDAQGHLAFDGLGDGTYTVEESTVPSGYLPTPASFTVTIKNGKASVKGTGLNAGLTGDNANLAEDGTVTVKNLDSISQLAQTGATGVTITVAMAGLLALGALAVLGRCAAAPPKTPSDRSGLNDRRRHHTRHGRRDPGIRPDPHASHVPRGNETTEKDARPLDDVDRPVRRARPRRRLPDRSSAHRARRFRPRAVGGHGHARRLGRRHAQGTPRIDARTGPILQPHAGRIRPADHRRGRGSIHPQATR